MPKQPMIPQPRSAAPSTAPSTPAPGTLPGLPLVQAEVYEEDFSDVKEGFPMADPGLHHAKVIDFDRADSKSGNPQYVWQFRITAGQSKGTEIRYWTSLLPQARWKTAETLDAIGIKAAGSIARFTKTELLGRPCIIEVIHDTYDGKLNHKIQKVHPPNEDSAQFAKSEATPF